MLRPARENKSKKPEIRWAGIYFVSFVCFVVKNFVSFAVQLIGLRTLIQPVPGIFILSLPPGAGVCRTGQGQGRAG